MGTPALRTGSLQPPNSCKGPYSLCEKEKWPQWPLPQTLSLGYLPLRLPQGGEGIGQGGQTWLSQDWTLGLSGGGGPLVETYLLGKRVECLTVSITALLFISCHMPGSYTLYLIGSLSDDGQWDYQFPTYA